MCVVEGFRCGFRFLIHYTHDGPEPRFCHVLQTTQKKKVSEHGATTATTTKAQSAKKQGGGANVPLLHCPNAKKTGITVVVVVVCCCYIYVCDYII